MFKKFGLYQDAYSQRLAQMQQVVAEIKSVSQPSQPSQLSQPLQPFQPPHPLQPPQRPSSAPPMPNQPTNGRGLLETSVRPAEAAPNAPHYSPQNPVPSPPVGGSVHGSHVASLHTPNVHAEQPPVGGWSHDLVAASVRPAESVSPSDVPQISGLVSPSCSPLAVGPNLPLSVQAASVRPLGSGPFGLPGERSPSISNASSISNISINHGDNTYPPTALATLAPLEAAQLPRSPDIEMMDAPRISDLPGEGSRPRVPQTTSAPKPVLKRLRSHSDLEALTRDARASEHDHGKGSKPKPSGSNKRVKENGTSKGRGKQKAPIPKSDGFESTYDTDDESSDDDAKTVATVYDQDDQPGKETDFAKVLKFLEAIALKLDVALKKEPPVDSAQPNQPAHTIIEVTPAGSAPKRDRATRRKENLRPWDGDAQQVLDMRPTDPQQREKERVALQGYIRLLIMKALGRPQRKSPLPPGPPPEIDLPTLERFFIDWYKDINDNFNQTACAIITQQVIEDWSTLFSMSDWDDIFQMVKAHIKYLIKAYKRQELGRDDPSERARLLQAAATRRKHTTYRQRLFVTKIVPELNTHRRLLIDLGIDGTSSDEEDPERPGHYYVKKIKQLSSNVQELKQLFDHTFETLQKGPGTKGSRGRKRIRGRLVSNRKFRIQGLPVNCLNRKWYQKLTKTQKSYYKFAQYKYNFAFPKELTCM